MEGDTSSYPWHVSVIVLATAKDFTFVGGAFCLRVGIYYILHEVLFAIYL